MERERTREREPEQKDSGDQYNQGLNIYAAERERAQTGQIVIRARDIPWRQNRQALVKTFLSAHGVTDTAASNWICFIMTSRSIPVSTVIKAVFSCSFWKVKAPQPWMETNLNGRSGTWLPYR